MRFFAPFAVLLNLPIFANVTWPSYWYFSKSLAIKIILPAFAVEVFVVKVVLRGSLVKTVSACAVANAITSLFGYFYLKGELSPMIWLNLPITTVPFSAKDMIIHSGVILFLNTFAEFLIYKAVMYRINVGRVFLGSLIANLSSLCLTLAILNFSE